MNWVRSRALLRPVALGCLIAVALALCAGSSGANDGGWKDWSLTVRLSKSKSSERFLVDVNAVFGSGYSRRAATKSVGNGVTLAIPTYEFAGITLENRRTDQRRTVLLASPASSDARSSCVLKGRIVVHGHSSLPLPIPVDVWPSDTSLDSERFVELPVLDVASGRIPGSVRMTTVWRLADSERDLVYSKSLGRLLLVDHASGLMVHTLQEHLRGDVFVSSDGTALTYFDSGTERQSEPMYPPGRDMSRVVVVCRGDEYEKRVDFTTANLGKFGWPSRLVGVQTGGNVVVITRTPTRLLLVKLDPDIHRGEVLGPRTGRVFMDADANVLLQLDGQTETATLSSVGRGSLQHIGDLHVPLSLQTNVIVPHRGSGKFILQGPEGLAQLRLVGDTARLEPFASGLSPYAIVMAVEGSDGRTVVYATEMTEGGQSHVRVYQLE